MNEQQQRIQPALQDRYAIEREIGRGGMATVFLARDLRHKRPVAIKVLRDELAAALGADRFLREIEIAAALQHPLIIPVYDSGQAGDTLFYVMPYIEGQSLRDLLAREGRLSIDQSLRITRDVAEAVEYAHEQGIIHRDIKPENILLSGSHALVADFGIARAISRAGTTNMTQAGLVLGTPGYMAPEQVADPNAVDRRTDVYALGCVLFECLTGEIPHAAITPQSMFARRLVEPPPDVRSTRAEVPPGVARAVQSALAPAPDERLPTAAALSTALAGDAPVASDGAQPGRRLAPRTIGAIAAAVGVIGVAGALLLQGGGSRTAAVPDRITSIAVLPLRNLGEDRSNEYFADGMTEELIGALSKISGLRVAPRSSSFTFKTTTLSARDIGRQLHVDAVIDGSVQRLGDELRLRAQLVSVANDSVLWSESFPSTFADAFALQDRLTANIISQLKPRLSGSPDRAVITRGTADLEAYDAYLKGRYYQGPRTMTGLERSIPFFERAVARDSNFALAWSGLADSHSLLAAYGDESPPAVIARARAAGMRALALDSSRAEVRTSVGMFTMFYDHEFDRAEREFNRAIELDSTYTFGRTLLGWLYTMTGRTEQAVAEMQTAVRIEPLSLLAYARLGMFLYYARRYDDAIVQMKRALELDSTFALAHAELSHVYATLGRVDEAIAERAKSGDFINRYEAAFPTPALAAAGRTAEARKELNERLARARTEYDDAPAIAMTYLALGEKNKALDWLERGLDERPWSMCLLGVEPVWDPIRTEPRFVAVLRQVGVQ